MLSLGSRLASSSASRSLTRVTLCAAGRDTVLAPPLSFPPRWQQCCCISCSARFCGCRAITQSCGTTPTLSSCQPSMAPLWTCLDWPRVGCIDVCQGLLGGRAAEGDPPPGDTGRPSASECLRGWRELAAQLTPTPMPALPCLRVHTLLSHKQDAGWHAGVFV